MTKQLGETSLSKASGRTESCTGDSRMAAAGLRSINAARKSWPRGASPCTTDTCVADQEFTANLAAGETHSASDEFKTCAADTCQGSAELGLEKTQLYAAPGVKPKPMTSTAQ
mmetsp:Transcript_32520/g.77720  ORF Transcript_32520/g.77720 Transcript_32520/m.77720 type:complete len:113 (-) Transcript_32520:225-563(-)